MYLLQGKDHKHPDQVKSWTSLAAVQLKLDWLGPPFEGLLWICFP